MGTLVAAILVFGIVAIGIKSMIRDKKNGKSVICGGECKHCGGHYGYSE